MKTCGRAVQFTEDYIIQRTRFACRITKATRTQICDIYWVSTETMVTRTLFSVMLCVRCVCVSFSFASTELFWRTGFYSRSLIILVLHQHQTKTQETGGVVVSIRFCKVAPNNFGSSALTLLQNLVVTLLELLRQCTGVVL